MEPLKVGISGVRGVVGETLDPGARRPLRGGVRLVPRRRPRARLPRPAALGADAAGGGRPRVSSPSAARSPISASARRPASSSRSAGLGARGGISITGGHNPPEWNALKFVRDDGLYLSAIQGEELLDVYHQGTVAARTLGPHRRRASTGTTRCRRTSRRCAPRSTSRPVRARRLRVAVDCGNGSCSRLVPALARGARLRRAADQRRPGAAVPALARAGRRRGRPGARARAARAAPTSASSSTPTASG